MSSIIETLTAAVSRAITELSLAEDGYQDAVDRGNRRLQGIRAEQLAFQRAELDAAQAALAAAEIAAAAPAVVEAPAAEVSESTNPVTRFRVRLGLPGEAGELAPIVTYARELAFRETERPGRPPRSRNAAERLRWALETVDGLLQSGGDPEERRDAEAAVAIFQCVVDMDARVPGDPYAAAGYAAQVVLSCQRWALGEDNELGARASAEFARGADLASRPAGQ